MFCLDEDDNLYEVEFNLTNHNSHPDKALDKGESQNIKMNGHKNKKKSSSPENRYLVLSYNAFLSGFNLLSIIN